MKDGFPPIVLPVEYGFKYYEALDTVHVKNDYQPFINLIAKVCEDAFKPYWFALGFAVFEIRKNGAILKLIIMDEISLLFMIYGFLKP